MNLGPSEIIVVMVVALLILGPDKLPAAARQLGKVYRDLRDMSHSVRSQVESALELDDAKKGPPIPSGPSDPDAVDKPANPDTAGFQLIEDTPQHARPAPDDPALEIDPDAPPARHQEP